MLINLPPSIFIRIVCIKGLHRRCDSKGSQRKIINGSLHRFKNLHEYSVKIRKMFGFGSKLNILPNICSDFKILASHFVCFSNFEMSPKTVLPNHCKARNIFQPALQRTHSSLFKIDPLTKNKISR